MVCSDELQCFYYLAKCWCTGRGAIVDCGPLAGASTIAFASGAAPSTLIHSYDLWRFCTGWEQFFPNRQLSEGDDLLPAFLSNLNGLSSSVIAHQGDLATQPWSDGPIELMFIDAAKTPAVMHNLVTEFFPYLVPGAIVIHQDYVSSQCPWIHVAVMLLRDFFEWMDSPSGGTVCARLIRPIPRGILPADYYDALPLEDANRLIAEAADVCVGWERLCVKLAGATLFVQGNQRDRATQIRDDIANDPGFTQTYVGPDLALVNSMLMEGF